MQTDFPNVLSEKDSPAEEQFEITTARQRQNDGNQNDNDIQRRQAAVRKTYTIDVRLIDE